MASSSTPTCHLWAEPVDPPHGGGRLALAPGLSGRTKRGHSPEAVVAKGHAPIDAGIEAANDMDGPRQTIPAPARHLVPDAAQ